MDGAYATRGWGSVLGNLDIRESEAPMHVLISNGGGAILALSEVFQQTMVRESGMAYQVPVGNRMVCACTP